MCPVVAILFELGLVRLASNLPLQQWCNLLETVYPDMGRRTADTAANVRSNTLSSSVHAFGRLGRLFYQETSTHAQQG